MEEVRTVREFALKNEEDLRRFMISKTRIHDPEMIREAIQDFYVKLIQSRSLEKFDPTKGTFKTYIMNLFSWQFPIHANRNVSVKYTFVSQVKDRDRWGHWDGQYVDVFEGVTYGTASPYVSNAIDPCYEASHARQEEDVEAERTVQEFLDFISHKLPERSKKHLIPFVKYRHEGCNGADIAKILGVSNNMVKMVKDRARATYEEWRGQKMTPGKKARKLTQDEVANEIAQVQALIKRHNAGEIDLPGGFVYREAVQRLKYLRNRQSQLGKRRHGSSKEE